MQRVARVCQRQLSYLLYAFILPAYLLFSTLILSQFLQTVSSVTGTFTGQGNVVMQFLLIILCYRYMVNKHNHK